MAKIKTAKDILFSHDFLSAREKSQRYVKHEFQDYAYRLAVDLGDITHRQIYMRLAKTEDRTMLEQAAAFALGYFKEKNKGKIFMWKLAELRANRLRKQEMQNFEVGFVQKKMGSLADELLSEYKSKQRHDLDARVDALREFMSLSQQLPATRKKRQILVLGCGIGLEAEALAAMEDKVIGVDSSAGLIKLAKKNSKLKNLDFKYKADIFSHSFKPAQFAGIWCSTYWGLITQQEEENFWKLLTNLTPEQCVIYLEIVVGDKPVQSWQEFEWKEKKYIKFEKISKTSEVEKTAKYHGWKLQQGFQLPKSRVGMLWKKL